MSIRRRELLGGGLTAVVAPACRTTTAQVRTDARPLGDWPAVRAEFPLSRQHIHLALMLVTSHPRTVRQAIEIHRRALDENPTDHFEQNFTKAEAQVRAAAARYMGGEPDAIALTDSTTMSLAVLYGGLQLREGDEVLTTVHDHYATHENLRLVALRAPGAQVRKATLYDEPAAATADAMVAKLVAELTPKTRVVAVTWVHSSTGVKLPVRRMADAIAEANRTRGDADRILFCVDGVHGFGVESERPSELGCDFFAAGCHKWMFGPRGTGVLWGQPLAWKAHVPIIPAFALESYVAWMRGQLPEGPPGPIHTPGGFHSFEHRWALGEAFAFHELIGRERITGRIHALARQCKEGLAAMPKVKVHTPMDEAVSSGLVCFEVAGLPAPEVVKRLHARRIIASVTPYATEYARFSPGIVNTPEEIEAVLREVRAL